MALRLARISHDKTVGAGLVRPSWLAPVSRGEIVAVEQRVVIQSRPEMGTAEEVPLLRAYGSQRTIPRGSGMRGVKGANNATIQTDQTPGRPGTESSV